MTKTTATASTIYIQATTTFSLDGSHRRRTHTYGQRYDEPFTGTLREKLEAEMAGLLYQIYDGIGEVKIYGFDAQQIDGERYTELLVNHRDRRGNYGIAKAGKQGW